jgi:hypothetical protein
MKIIHASIPADEPRRAAEVLADIMSGEALPFPPGGPDSWMAWSGDGKMELEIVSRGKLLAHHEDQGHWVQTEHKQRNSECHLAIGVARPAEEIIAIAAKAGWPARLCSRGNGYFELVEVWVDGCFMLELFDPEQAAHYERVVTPENWKQFLTQIQAVHAEAPAAN